MTTCRMRFLTNGTCRYSVDGKDVDEWTYAKAKKREAAEQRIALRGKMQRGRRFRVPGCFGDFGDFRRDVDQKRGVNGARYFGQLARYPGDKRAFFTSKRQALEAAKRRGMVEDNS